jgi:predicted transcriptional regulator
MPTSMMANVHNSASAFADQAILFTMHNAHSPLSPSIFGQNSLPQLTTYSMNLLKQQMDESNHEMVNLLTQQIGTVFNALIRDTTRSYQALTTQMGRIADFFAPP